ncbi:MAG: hypothetical protein P8Y28_10620, partial [Gammaproteobacteria bacterium]
TFYVHNILPCLSQIPACGYSDNNENRLDMRLFYFSESDTIRMPMVAGIVVVLWVSSLNIFRQPAEIA